MNTSKQTNKQTNQRAKIRISAHAKMQLVSSVNEPTQDRLQRILFCCLVLVNRPNFTHESRDNGFFVHMWQRLNETFPKIHHQPYQEFTNPTCSYADCYSVIEEKDVGAELCLLCADMSLMINWNIIFSYTADTKCYRIVSFRLCLFISERLDHYIGYSIYTFTKL